MRKQRSDNSLVSIGYVGAQEWCVKPRTDDILFNSIPHWRLRNGAWSGGGPFMAVHDHRSFTFGPTVSGTSSRADLCWQFRPVPNYLGVGWLNANTAKTGYRKPSSLAVQQASYAQYGASGWKRTAPGSPGVGLGVMLAEAGGGLPSLPGRLLSRLARFRSLGKEYLNLEFGWKPLLSDIRKMYQTYKDLDRHLAQLQRDNGKGIRRRLDLGTTDSSTTTFKFNNGWVGLAPAPTFGAYGSQSSSSWTLRTSVNTRIWYSARYRYWIPDVGTSQWTRRATRALFGLNPTPGLLWDALPWSWLADYFANVGDIMSNLSSNAAENLTADYAYLMVERVNSHSCECVFSGAPAYKTSVYNMEHQAVPHFSCSYSDVVTTRMRFAASPYGFGVNYGGLTDYQKGILAALGISRSRF